MIIKKLWVKICLMFIIVITPIIVFVIWAYVYSGGELQDKNLQINIQALTNVGDGVSRNITEIQGFFEKVLFSDSDIIKFPLFEKGSVDYELGKQRLLNKFRLYMLSVGSIDSLFMSSQRNDFSTTFSRHTIAEKTEWINQDLADASRNNMLAKYDWTAVRIADKVYLRKYFFIENDMDAGILVEIEALTGGVIEDEYTFVFDSDGTPLVHKGGHEQMYPVIIDSFLNNGEENGERYITHDRTDYYMIKKRIAGTPLYLVTLVQKSAFAANGLFQIIFSILLLACLSAIGLFFLFLQRELSVPMNTLLEAMRKVGKEGNMDVEIGETKSYEFNFLINIFLEMMEQIKKLKINVYEQKLIASDAKIQLLQNQINPHFLMNSMNIISSLAQLKENTLIQRFALHLADYYRFAMGVNRKFVSCNEELRHLSNYLEIQSYRYVNQLKYEIAVRQEHLSLMIPPLILEPFIENAVQHGFIKKAETFYIRVSSYENADSIVFEITDNGQGMEQEQLDSLNLELDSVDYKYSSIGVWNVKKRILQYFGEDASVKFESVPNQGTKVSIAIPKEGIL